MKNRFLLILYCFFFFLSFSQNKENVGVILEYNELLEVEYITYSPPLKVLQVDSQLNIDYSKVEGLIQSFFSASNLEWALSDYLSDDSFTARDEDHFEAVKNNNGQDYIQIESVYKFDYNFRQFAYVKYSFIMNKIPFPLIGIMSVENNKDRWYISNLLNQSDIFAFFTNFDQNVIRQLFAQQSNNQELINIHNKLIDSEGNFDFIIMNKFFDNLMSDSETKRLLKDKRLIIEGIEYRNAILNVTPEKSTYKVNHPFLIEKAIFSKYTDDNIKVVNDDKAKKRFLNEPENILLNEKPITLINKLFFVKTILNITLLNF